MSFLKEDKKHKTDLVTLFKILDYHNLSDLTANHASVISDDKKIFLYEPAQIFIFTS